MGTYDHLYAQWAGQRNLDEFTLERVLSYILRTSDIRSLRSLLNVNDVPEALGKQLSASTNLKVLGVWLESKRCSTEERTRLLATLPVADLRALYPAPTSTQHRIDEEILVQLWARGDDELRLQVIANVRWPFKPPASWKQWLNTQLSGALLTPEVITSLARGCEEYVWNTFAKSRHARSLEALACVYQGSEHRREWYRNELIERCATLLTRCEEKPRLVEKHATSIETTLRVLFAPEGRAEKTPREGSVEMELALRAVQLLRGDQRHDLIDDLNLREATKRKTLPASRADLLASLQDLRAELTAEQLHAAATALSQGAADELWVAACQHPKLTAKQAAQLVSEAANGEAALTALLATTRTRKWRVSFAVSVFEHYHSRPHTPALLRGLSWSERDAATQEIVQTNPSHIDELNRMRLVTRSTLGALPAAKILQYSSQYPAEILELTRARLGENPGAWEIVESLIDEYTGSYEDLLETAAGLIEV